MSTPVSSWRETAWLALLLIGTAGCSDAPLCDASALAAALDGASAGDQVEIGACRIEGAFRLPAGVTLVGQGSSSVLVGPSGPEPTLRLALGSDATRLQGLRIESSAPAACTPRALAQWSSATCRSTLGSAWRRSSPDSIE